MGTLRSTDSGHTVWMDYENQFGAQLFLIGGRGCL